MQSYLRHTFQKLYLDHENLPVAEKDKNNGSRFLRIIEPNSDSRIAGICFNTGLLSKNHQPIYFYGKKYYDRSYPKISRKTWGFDCFCVRGDKKLGGLSLTNQLPDLAQYYRDITDMFFNPELPIELNIDLH